MRLYSLILPSGFGLAATRYQPELTSGCYDSSAELWNEVQVLPEFRIKIRRYILLGHLLRGGSIVTNNINMSLLVAASVFLRLTL